MKTIGLVILLTANLAIAKEEVELKSVSLLDFMQGDLIQSIPINLKVPESYESFEFEEDEPGTIYWMRPKDAKKAMKSKDLPSKKGYMYGKISLNVGYDESEDLFIGLEEPETQAQYRSYFSEYSLERVSVKGYPVAFLRVVQKGSDKASYMMYIGLKVATNAVMIVYIPPKRNTTKGDFVWSEQFKYLTSQNRVASDPEL